MHPYRLFPLVALAALVACASDDPTAQEIDLQDAPEVSAPLHPTSDGERTRLRPVVDPLPRDVLADRLERAEVAFVGQVVAIDHAEVDLPEIGLAPHRFVTFQVEDAVKGGVAGETVTLRFLGGTVGDTTLEASGIPEFEVGERDLLFVTSDNGDTHCPLVDCESGRLPVVGDQITAPTGHRLVELADGRLRFGAPLEVPVPDPGEEDHELSVDPVGTPIVRADFVRRAARPGPSAAPLSVTPIQPSR